MKEVVGKVTPEVNPVVESPSTGKLVLANLASVLVPSPAAPVLRRVTDILGDQTYQGNMYKIPQILDKELVLTGFKVRQGEESEYMILTCQTVDTGEEFGVTCGSKVVMGQVRQLEEANAFPCLARFQKIRKYYILV